MAANPFRRVVLTALAAAVLIAAGGYAGWLAGRTTSAPPGASSVDVGFLRDMADHHDQAVQLSLLVVANGEDRVLRDFAIDTIASQRYEIGLMDARLQDWRHGRGTVNRQVMAWMSMPVPLDRMPGLASREDLGRLAAARGADADVLFVDLMVTHHEGGIHMAEHAWRHAETSEVRALAETIAKIQRIEIRDLLRARARLTRSGSGA